MGTGSARGWVYRTGTVRRKTCTKFLYYDNLGGCDEGACLYENDWKRTGHGVRSCESSPVNEHAGGEGVCVKMFDEDGTLMLNSTLSLVGTFKYL